MARRKSYGESLFCNKFTSSPSGMTGSVAVCWGTVWQSWSDRCVWELILQYYIPVGKATCDVFSGDYLKGLYEFSVTMAYNCHLRQKSAAPLYSFNLKCFPQSGNSHFHG